jgi:alpha-L-fucosidase
MTMGDSWSFVPNDRYKSAHELIHLLVKIVSRGGNFLLNIGPGPDGDWAPAAYDRLEKIGDWMKINGEGIYASQSVAPYSARNIFYTKAKNKPVLYAFWLSDTEALTLPATLEIPLEKVGRVKAVRLLGRREKISWRYAGNTLHLKIPAAIQQKSGLKQAAAFRIEL